MSSPDLLPALASYIPDLIIRQIAAKNPGEATSITEATATSFKGVVLFADISGFTPLTERLSAKGPVGAEELSWVLNSFFGKLVNMVIQFGGDITNFAGDGLIAVWTPEGVQTDTHPDSFPSIQSLTRQTLACSLAIQEALSHFEAGENHLSLKIALSVGEASLIHLGGVFNRWEFFIAGQPISEVGIAETKAKPGEIILAPSAWELLHDVCQGTEIENGHYRLESANMLAKEDIRTHPNLNPAKLALRPILADLSPNLEAGLRSYIPAVVLKRLSAFQSGFLPELRNVTIIFVNLPDMKYGVPLAQAQEAIRTIQSSLYRFEGSVNKIGVDDKGVSLVAALGLPPFSHEDDPARGVRAALTIHENLTRLGWRSSIGIASGRVFCGTIGNAVRQEYNMMGDAVPLAARLMQAAKGSILSDAVTYRAAKSQVDFEILDPIPIKGKAERVAIFRPLHEATTAIRPPTEIVGRERERTLIAEQLQALVRGHAGGVMIIEGEAGIGKSRLVEDILRQAHAMGIPTLVGAGDAIEQGSKYHAWRTVFRQVFGIDASGDLTESIPLLAQQQEAILLRLESDPELKRLAPLLNDVLPLGWTENDLTAEMEGEIRANNTRELLIQILQNIVTKSPKVLILDDAHWLDSASWSLALAVAQRVSPILIILANRPIQDVVSTEFRQLSLMAGVNHLFLETLPAADTEKLVCQRLGVSTLPKEIGTLIRERAEGHPFFSEELAFALRDAGYIAIKDGQCRVVDDIDLQAIPFPRTIEGVITRRIDRLSSDQQLVIKVASVIGRLFALRVLQAIFPAEEQKLLLPEHARELEKRDLTLLDTPDPDLAYIFKHIITQEVAYNLMLFSQRRGLHQNVAAWYETTYADNLPPYYPLLAYHWSKAENRAKAIDYLAKAGEQAVHSYANQEALRFFEEALTLDAKSPTPVDQVTRARWHLLMGEAHIGLGSLKEARENLERGLEMAGEYVPKTVPQAMGRLFGEIILQIRHRLNPAKYLGKKKGTPGISAELLQAHERLGELYYYVNQTDRIMYYDLHLLNLAESYLAYTEMARAYGTLAAIAGLLNLHPLARAYRDRAHETCVTSGQLSARVGVNLTTGLYAGSIGEWENSKNILLTGERVSAQLGDLRRQGQNTTVLIETLYHKGEFQAGIEWGTRMEPQSRRRNDIQAVGYALLGRAECLLALGETERGIADLEEVESLVNQLGQSDANQKIYVYGLLGAVNARQGNWTRAYALAHQSVKAGAGILPNSHFIVEGYAGAAEAFLRIWEAKERSGLSAEQIATLPKDISRAMTPLRLFTFTFPIGKPYLERLNGLQRWIKGNRGRALKSWQKSLGAAQKLNMNYQMGITHREIANHLPEDDPLREKHLTQAIAIFEKLRA